MRTFQEYLIKIKPEVDERIRAIAESRLKDPDIIPMLLKGKRLRAGLLLLVFDSITEKTKDRSKAIDLACAIELAHSASLILDDMLDEDTERRGLPAIHLKKGHKKAMLDTIGVLSIPYDIVSQYGEVYAQSLAETQRSMVWGVVGELFRSPNLPATKLYHAIISQKTGKLFGLAAGWGCIAGTPEHMHGSKYQWAEPVQIEGEKKGLVMDHKGNKTYMPPCKDYQRCLFGGYGVQCGVVMQTADDMADLQKMKEGKKTNGFGSEMMLLRCMTVDRLVKQFFIDLRNQSLSLSRVKELLTQEGIQKSLQEMLDREIKKARDVITALSIPYIECEEVLMDAPAGIADMMLKEG